MVDQPGAGGSRSYKIRGYTRERQSAKPYARPPGRKKGVIETVKDFFSPAWLVDLFKGNQGSQPIEIEDADDEDEHNEVSRTIEESSSSNSDVRSSSVPTEVSARTNKVGNGQLRSSFGPGYFSSILRERELSSDIPSTSRPSRTFGLSSGNNPVGEASTSSARSEKLESEVPSSRREDEIVQLDTVMEEDLSVLHVERQEKSKPDSIVTSTPAMFSYPGSKRRANTSIFGEPLPMTEASTSKGANKFRPQLFLPSSESRPGPQPFSFPKNRPSFSVSAFGSPLPPKPAQASGFSSPFYHGKTSFGGASSLHSTGYKRLRTGSPTLGEAPQPVRKVITPKPVSTAGSSGVTSQTAKRILEALESMSSPLIDARKIPTPPISPSASPLSFSPAKRRRPPIPSRAVGSPRSLKAHFPGPPVQDLSVPQQASISQLRTRETVSPKGIATSSSSLFSTATTTIPTFSKPSLSSFHPTPLPISLSPSSSSTKAGGKVKSSRSTSHYTQRDRGDDRNDAEVVNPIPEVTTAVALPLPNGKFLPSFSFAPTSQTRTTTSTTNQMSVSTGNTTATVDLTKNNFKFSTPAAKVPSFSQDSASASQSGSSEITFSFSQPAPVTKSDTSSVNKTSLNKQDKSFVLEVKQTEKPVEPNNNLLNKFAPLPGSWTCDTCLVSNKATDTKCVACQSSKPSTGKPAPKKPVPMSNDLMVKFAPTAGSWSCEMCMLSNDASKTKCPACETPKPGPKPAKPVVNSDNDLMKKFAPPADAWSCDTCMLQNKSTDSACVVCQTPKPGAANTAKTIATPSFGVSTNALSDSSLAAKFAPPADAWSCDTCMVQNKSTDNACVACKSPKPGAAANTAKTTATPSFGVSTNAASDSRLAAKFAPAAGSWTCDTCMISNKGEDSACVACQTPKPGAKPPGMITAGGFSLPGGQTFSSSPFKFGVDNASDANFSSASTIKFGVDTKSTGGSSSSATFTFGSNTANQNSTSDSDQGEGSRKLPATFRFGASASQPSDSGTGETTTNATLPFSFGSPAVNHTGKDDSAAAQGFSFGVGSSSGKDKASAGGFMLGASNEDKPNSIAAAAASGFLKVPEMKEPAKTTGDQSSLQTGSGMSIADAAKSGFLKVPTPGEKKVDFASPPNVNLFAPVQTASGSSATKPETGFALAAPSGAPSPFAFGSATAASSVTAPGALGQGSGATSSSVPFQFGAVPSSTVAASSQVASTAALAASPFSLPVNTVAPAKTTAAATSFSFMANAAAPVTTPAVPFTFGSNSVSTAATAAATAAGATFQFAPGSGAAASLKPEPSVPSGSTPLFPFGATNTASVTSSSTQPTQQTFGITSTPANSSSETSKPFAFNAGSTVQGFSFAPAKPAATAGAPSSFTFGGAAPKPEATFPVFGATQTPSNQQASAAPFMFAPSSNSAPAPSEETMEADGNNSSGNLFASPANAAGSTFGSSGPSTGFAFGAPSAPAAGGFNFGAAQANAGSSTFAFAPSGGGTPAFGASSTPAATAPAPGGGFNFGAATVNNSQIGSPGMFNFAAGSATPQGNTLFTAGTAGDPNNSGIAQRKFKKAVRRTRR